MTEEDVKEFENKVNVLEDEKMMIQSELDKKIELAATLERRLNICYDGMVVGC